MSHRNQAAKSTILGSQSIMGVLSAKLTNLDLIYENYMAYRTLTGTKHYNINCEIRS